MTETRCEPPTELRGVDGWHWLEVDEANCMARWCHPNHGSAYGWRIMGVESLRASSAYEQGYRYLSPVLTPAEVSALRAERDALKLREWSITDQLRRVAEERETALAELATLRAENARLRQALAKWIGARDALSEFERDHPGHVGKQWTALFEAAAEAEELARAALEPKP